MAYGYCKLVTIDHTKVAGNETDFPMLFNTTDSDLATVGNGGKVTSASGYDIVFSASPDGASPYPHEIESYTAASGAFVAWVKIPSLSSSVDTLLYIVFGDSGVTTSQEAAATLWAGYNAVYHLKEASGTRADSSGNGLTLTDNNTVTQRAGQIGSAAEFVAANTEWLSHTHDALLDGGDNDYTIECWFYSDLIGGVNYMQVTKLKTSDYDYQLFLGGTDIQFQAFNGATTKVIDLHYVGAEGAWHYVVAQHDKTANKGRLSADGGAWAEYSETATPGTSAALFGIGGREFSNQPADGAIDEVRFYPGLRDINYVATAYANQNSPGTFYSLGGISIVVALDKLSLASSHKALDLIPGAVSMPMDKLTLSSAAQALGVSPGAVSVAMDKLLLTSLAQSLDVVPGAVSVALDKLVLASATLGITVSAGTVIALSKLVLAGAAQALDLVPGAVSVDLDRLTLAGVAQALDLVPGAVSVALDRLLLASTLDSLGVVPGGVSLALDKLVLASSLKGLTVSPGAVSIDLDRLLLSSTAQALDLVPGAVTVSMDKLALTAGIPSLTLLAQTYIAMDKLGLTAAVKDLSVVPGAVTITLDKLILASAIPGITPYIPGDLVVALLTLALTGIAKGINIISGAEGLTVQSRDIAFTVRARDTDFVVQARDTEFTVRVRDDSLTSQARDTDFTVKDRI